MQDWACEGGFGGSHINLRATLSSNIAAQLVKVSQGYGVMERHGPTSPWTHPAEFWKCVFMSYVL